MKTIIAVLLLTASTLAIAEQRSFIDAIREAQAHAQQHLSTPTQPIVGNPFEQVVVPRALAEAARDTILRQIAEIASLRAQLYVVSVAFLACKP